MNIGSYELESPVLNGGGVVKTMDDVLRMARTGVGAIVAGSYTLEPRGGNSPNGETVYHHDEDTGITYNALGMPNKGLEAVVSELPTMLAIAHDHGKPLVLNLAPVTADPVAEIVEMGAVLYDAKVKGIDAIELNASCPNVVTEDGGREELLSHHPKLLARVLFEMGDIIASELKVETLMVRISPFRQRHHALEMAEVLEEAGINIVTAFNTFPGGIPLDSRGEHVLKVPGGAGGQSGPGMAAAAEEQTDWLIGARGAVSGSFDIVGSNGIMTGEQMRSRMDLGATAVSCTTLFWESRRWGHAVDHLLQEYSRL